MPREGSPQQRGKRYRIRYFDHDGKRCSETFKKKTGATARLREVQLQVRRIRSSLVAAPKPVVSVADLCDRWLIHKGNKKSLDDDRCIIRKHIRPRIGLYKLDELSSVRVDEMKHALLDTVTVARTNRVIALLRSMLNWAKEEKWVDDPVRVRLEPEPEREQAYLKSSEEIDRFLQAARKFDGDLQYFFRKSIRDYGTPHHDLYAVAILTGMRAGELAALKVEDIDMERRAISVSKSWDRPTTKSTKTRTITVQEQIVPVLKRRIAKRKAGNLFVNADGSMFIKSARIFREDLHRVLKLGGFPERELSNGKRKPYITFHDLRHTFASHWMMNGGDIYALKLQLGHHSVDVTEKYSHFAPHALRAERTRLSLGLKIA